MKWYEDKEYWIMSEEGEEIQEEWKPKAGDWIYAKDWGMTSIKCPRAVLLTSYGSPLHAHSKKIIYNIFTYQYSSSKNEFDFKKSAVWLPSQEDLQEMLIENKYRCAGILLRDFVWWVIRYDRYASHGDVYYPFDEDFILREPTTMTKLWLAFCMYELYQKRWNPETKKWESSK